MMRTCAAVRRLVAAVVCISGWTQQDGQAVHSASVGGWRHPCPADAASSRPFDAVIPPLAPAVTAPLWEWLLPA